MRTRTSDAAPPSAPNDIPSARPQGQSSQPAAAAPAPAGSSSVNCTLARLQDLKARPRPLTERTAPRQKLRPEFHELGAYLQMREYIGHPVTGDQDIKDLVVAQMTVHETRTRLLHGRGNVRQDAQRTEGAAERRTRAGRTFAKLLDKEAERSGHALTPFDYAAHTVASATLFGAGNCAEHARLAAFLHTQRMRPDQQVQVVAASNEDHAWAAVVRPGRMPIFMDAWKEGPAILARDAESAASRNTKPGLTLGANPAAWRAIHTIVEREKPRTAREMQARLNNEWGVWPKTNARSVFDSHLNAYATQRPVTSTKALAAVLATLREAIDDQPPVPTPSLFKRIFQRSDEGVQGYEERKKADAAKESTRREAVQAKARVGTALDAMRTANRLLGHAPQPVALDETGKALETGRVAALAVNANGIVKQMDKLTKR
jgi:hypothetical protein